MASLSERLGTWKPVGKPVKGPVFDVYEVRGEDVPHHAIVFHPAWCGHRRLGAFSPEQARILQSPGNPSISPLVWADAPNGVFVYRTGEVVFLADVLLRLAGRPSGVRPGLELGYRVQTALQFLVRKGEPFGLGCHGSVDPWKVGITRAGEVRLIGAGLAPVEVVAYYEEGAEPPPTDSFRYAPPERLRKRAEDLRSDQYSLTLILAELIAGAPVYDGTTAAEVRQAARKGDGAHVLYDWANRDMGFRLPRRVANVLSRALSFEMDDRYTLPDPEDPMPDPREGRADSGEFGRALWELLGLPEFAGTGLSDVVRQTLELRRAEELAAGAAPATEVGQVAQAPLLAPDVAAPVAEAPAPASRWERRLNAAAAAPVAAPAERPVERALSRATTISDEGRPRRLGGAPRDEDVRPWDRAEPAPPPVEVPRPASRPVADAPRRLERGLPPDVTGPRRIGDARAPRTEEPRSEAPREPIRAVGGTEPKDVGETRRLAVVEPDGSVRNVRAKLTQPLAEVVDAIVRDRGGAAVDLTGHVLGHWRIVQGERRFTGDQSVASLVADDPFRLEWVPNRVVVAEVSVAGATVMRFQTPIGTAIPARQLAAAIARWLDLPARDYRLVANGIELSPFQILEDARPEHGVRLEVVA